MQNSKAFSSFSMAHVQRWKLARSFFAALQNITDLQVEFRKINEKQYLEGVKNLFSTLETTVSTNNDPITKDFLLMLKDCSLHFEKVVELVA